MIAAGGALAVPEDLAARVDDADYGRLLGYPAGRPLAGRVRELAAASREWYARNGRPWAFTRRLAVAAVTGGRVELADGALLASPLLARRLGAAGATALVAAAVSAGPEVDAASAEGWREQRPDEAYFLDRFGVAAVEHLAAWAARRLRSEARDLGLAALPGYSPGYPGWALEQQVVLGRCLTRGGEEELPGPLAVLASGATAPRSSLLAVFGLAPPGSAVAGAWERDRCRWCALARCAFRRAAGGRAGKIQPPATKDEP
ncbi:MAG: hypothetical protein OES32_08435 [Acidobacteriota bacterium]|nr:hypothetical protein [Acidobacteriota bacterium]MDH3523601.1 hypothetical protein [Acidobacteriota bacterium]